MEGQPIPLRPLDPEAAPQPLTATERNALLGLQARADQYSRIINDANREVVEEINARLGVVIGLTHGIDIQTWTVSPIPPITGEPGEPGEAGE